MPKTLLLADDSVTIQKVVGITFANEDVELVTVDNGADALARAKDLKPDLIMADVAMPGLGGYELCASIRRDPELCHIPVLLLTGTFETYDEQKALAAGASGHIAKPFEAQALISQFYALVDQDATRVVSPQAAMTPPAPAPAQSAPQPAAAPPTARPTAAPPSRAPQPDAPRPVAPPAQARPAAAPPAATRPVPPPQTPAGPAIDPLESTFPPMAADAPLQAEPADFDLPNTDFAAPAPAAPGRPGAALVADPDAVPSMPEIPAGDDFAFEDLDFNESGPSSSNTDTGIFGADSGSGVEDVAEPAHDPNGETAFLDPQAASHAAPHTPDPLADTIPEDPFANPNDDTNTFERPLHPPARGMRAQIEEAIPWAEPEPEAEPLAAAPLPPAAPAAQRPVGEQILELSESDTEPLDAEPLGFEDAEEIEPATVVAHEAFTTSARATTAPLPAQDTELFAPEPEPEVDLPAASPVAPHRDAQPVVLDPADVKSAVEKVAWEAFGALQDQLLREVTARAEAAIWEIVPQLAERLIREEIERLKRDAEDPADPL